MAGAIVGLGEILWDLLPTGPRAGGAPFNFTFHCHQLGHNAIIVSRVGDDELGQQLCAEVRRLGLTDRFIQVDRQHPTGTVAVHIDAAGQPSYTITEHVAWDYLEWDDDWLPLLQDCRAVCFGTLAQRSLVSRTTIQRLVNMVRPPAIVVCDVNLRHPFVDRNIIDRSIASASWVKLNEGERDEIAPLDEILLRGPSLVCMTRGDQGCLVRTMIETIDVPGMPIQVVDTVGAGDAFTAGLLTQVLEGRSLAQAARFANALAALTASREGGTPRIDRAEVEQRCSI